MGIHNNIVKLIVNLYAGQQAAVRLECGMSDWFSVSKGVRQGCILSPHLFSLYTEGIMREVEQDSRKDLYNEPNIQGLKLRDLRYADDTALLSTTTEGLHQLIQSVKEHSENKGLFLNIKKTKIVDTDRCKKTSDITVDGETVECLEKFEYLLFRVIKFWCLSLLVLILNWWFLIIFLSDMHMSDFLMNVKTIKSSPISTLNFQKLSIFMTKGGNFFCFCDKIWQNWDFK